MSNGFWKNPQERAPIAETQNVRITTDATTLQPVKERATIPIAGKTCAKTIWNFNYVHISFF